VIIALILLGRLLESRAKGRTSEAIKRLVGLQAKTARVLRDGQEQDIPVEEVVPGDIVLVRPGEKVPVDGVVVDGASALDESMLTVKACRSRRNRRRGVRRDPEQNGRLPPPGDKVGKDTALQQIVKLVQDAQGSKRLLPVWPTSSAAFSHRSCCASRWRPSSCGTCWRRRTCASPWRS
jgi:Cu+-exporting ATPase